MLYLGSQSPACFAHHYVTMQTTGFSSFSAAGPHSICYYFLHTEDAEPVPEVKHINLSTFALQDEEDFVSSVGGRKVAFIFETGHIMGDRPSPLCCGLAGGACGDGVDGFRAWGA